MDIFNRKRVKELERELNTAKNKNEQLHSELAALRLKFEAMGELEESIPEDCVRGPWCESCDFVKTFHYIRHYGLGAHDVKTAYVCGKGKSCNNFVQKKYEEE